MKKGDELWQVALDACTKDAAIAARREVIAELKQYLDAGIHAADVSLSRTRSKDSGPSRAYKEGARREMKSIRDHLDELEKRA